MTGKDFVAKQKRLTLEVSDELEALEAIREVFKTDAGRFEAIAKTFIRAALKKGYKKTAIARMLDVTAPAISYNS